MVRHIGFDPTASFNIKVPPAIDSSLYLPFDSDLNDDSPNAVTGTAVGGASISTSVKKFGAGSLDLNGTDEFVSYSNSNAYDFGSGDFTIEAWVYQTAAAGSAAADRHPIVSRMQSQTDRSWHFGIVESSGAQALQFSFTTDGNSSTQYEFGGDVTINTWHHVAVVNNGGTVTGYLNGTALGTTGNIGSSTIYAGFSNLTVGYRGLSQQHFQGYIDDLRIIKGYALYTAAFTPPTAAAGSTALLPSAFNLRSTFSVDQMREELAAGTWIPRAEGGTITTYGNYVVHTFTSSGTFINNADRTVDVLIVGGGGSGGQCNPSNSAGGGGGGAGGLITSSGTSGANSSPISPLALSAQSYSVVVGSGGAKPAFAEDQVGINGGDSSFAGITAIGGGGGGGNSTEGSVGGSGGGGAESNGVGRSGTANQGMAGGDGSENNDKGGGGGGAGQAGSDYNVSNGKGGDGLANSIQTGSPVYFAGGGGAGGSLSLGNGGAGGLGGGGAAGVAGTANTGGGGGSDLSGEAGAGGSGIVVIRYQI